MHCSEEMKEKIRCANLGRSHTEESKQKISKSLMGHPGAMKGKHHTEETKQKMALSKFNDKNPNWKGDDVGYCSIHEWIKNRKVKTDLCEQCKKNPPCDLANISGEYKRDVSDYEWLCRSCHMELDGRKVKFKNAFLGKHHSEESKQKLRELLSGENHPMFGKHHSEETKRKIREAQLGEKSPMFGKHRSEETKQKQREAMSGDKNPFFGKHHSDEVMKKIRETKLKNKLEKHGVAS